MLTLSDIIAIAIACKLWSVISDILADFIVDWKNSRKKRVDSNKTSDTISSIAQVKDELDRANQLMQANACELGRIPTSVPPPLKRGVVDINVRVK